MTSPKVLRVLFLVAAFSLPGSLPASEILVGAGPDILYLPLYVAAGQGYFPDPVGTGSKVELRLYASAGQAMEGLTKGEVDLAAASEWNILAAYGQREDFTLVALLAQAPQAIKLVARPWVKGLKELAKRKIGVQDNLASQYFLYRLEVDQGLDKKGRTTTVMPGPKLLAAFQNGWLDAFVALEPWPRRAVRTWKDKAFYLSLSPPPYIPGLYLVTRERFLKEKRSSLVAILRGLAAAAEFITKEPGQAAEMMARRVKGRQQELVRLLPGFVFGLSLSHQDKERIRQVAAWLMDQGHLEMEELPETFFASDLLSEGKLP